MKKPLISVVIPTYNEEHRVGRAIASLTGQTYANLEILVVDDQSTDQTKTIVETIAKKDPRVHYLLFPMTNEPRTNWRGYDINAGYAARNYGFQYAHGEWITTQDADDASLLNRVEVQYDLAIRYGATLVTIQWQELTPKNLNKKLDVETVFAEKGEEAIVIRPEAIALLAQTCRGPLMREPFHKHIPFPLKWFPYTRTLFYKNMDSYPGADNCMLFHRSVRDDGVFFRRRSERTWGVPSGRGSGRDFAFRVADRYRNSWSFRLPLYLWDVKSPNLEYANYGRYLIS